MIDTRLSADVLRDELRLPRVPEPNAMVIFRASGDLTARKLVPAIYDLAAQQRLPMEFAAVGVSRTRMSHEEFRKKLRGALDQYRPGQVAEDVWDAFSRGIFYLPGDSTKAQTYRELKSFLKKLDGERGTGGNRIFYLSSSPSLFSTVAENLGKAGLNEGENGGWAGLLGGKPFWRGLEDAPGGNKDTRGV